MSDFYTPGWVNDPVEVERVVSAWSAQQGCPARYADYLDSAADDERTVCLWDAEIKLYGKPRPTWDQRRVGTCVSFGWGRGANDVYLQLVATGKSSMPPGDVATEPIYGGSRHEVGGDRIQGDGSVGAWAAKWVRDWGILFRQVYPGGVDLREYSESLSRQWGASGVPDHLEPLARQQPVKAVAQVRTFREAWQSLGSRRPVPVASDQGFSSTLDGGLLRPSGNWAHQMVFRGRLVSRRWGRVLVCQNSWDKSWLRGDPVVEDKDGKAVELPEGCFCVDEQTADGMLRQGDSHTMSDVIGFPVKRSLDWVW